MMIDSHMHVNFNGLSLKDIIKYLDDNRIDSCWLLSWEEIGTVRWPYQHLSIEDVYDAYSRYPSRIVPMYAPDPHKGNATADLEYWWRKGIRGCGEMKSTLHWDSSEVRSMLTTLERLRMPLVFHMEESGCIPRPRSSAFYDSILCNGLRTERGIYRIPQRVLRLLINVFPPFASRLEYVAFPGYMLDFASLEIALQDYPNVNFIAHGPMFWKHISTDAASHKDVCPTGPVVGEGIIWRLLRDYPNLYADMSGESGLNALTRDRQNAKHFLSLFQDKMLYGTDNVIKGQRAFLDSLGLSRGLYSKVYGENALALLPA